LLDKNTTGEWKAVHRFHISLLHWNRCSISPF
jgi:hypothetical protein